jgi:parallel beta-helix repeat protein
MGFSLTGTKGGTSTGILIQGGCSNVEIRNGSVNNFGSGSCINGDGTSSGIRVIGVRASGTPTTAINLFGTNNLVMGCSFMDAGAGIFVGSGSMVKGNHVAGNSGTGIATSDGCTIAGNLCKSNGTGMWTSHGCSVLDNTVWNNGDYGIHAGSYCTITRNTARGNPTAGIYSGQYCTITNNTSQILTNGLNCTLANNTVYP